MSAEPLIEVAGVHKAFGGLKALNGISFTLAPGEVLGLAGPNGSGKTTTINAISGMFHLDGGEIRLAGRPLGRLPPHRRARMGINRTFQVPKPFSGLTTRQNVEVAAHFGGGGNADIDGLLARLNLADAAERPAGTLNSGQQKRLDLARALATGPRVLLVDEIGAGLNPEELHAMASLLRELAAEGLGLVVVEHLMDFLGQVTDRVVVMNAGLEIFGGTLREAAEDPQVIEVFLGKSA
ncbi:ABC transporter ATP-binding protein [Acidihalobacter yilgarnensis]|uniref:ABC transporter ATP-binding protein n=1 Tax=Acidihalobacter yilgarnensis TaxID=2819280 RepID=A0A1D8IRX8_9GAMM|nr:ABC transporter ATP-binding protein [Acidihalobacter yilgarnensis]AOU99216.1 ABC transporter ATP-binding protein [Acidihalobacter yilgarnensis]